MYICIYTYIYIYIYTYIYTYTIYRILKKKAWSEDCFPREEPWHAYKQRGVNFAPAA